MEKAENTFLRQKLDLTYLFYTLDHVHRETKKAYSSLLTLQVLGDVGVLEPRIRIQMDAVLHPIGCLVMSESSRVLRLVMHLFDGL